jgi:chemotaxis methyl-accepting protein methylase
MQRRETIPSDSEPAHEIDEGAIAIDIEPVLEVLRTRVGVDFSQYQQHTLYRRIARRVRLHSCDGLASYVSTLKANPGEAEALYHDILIGVTSFFRNPEAYEALKAEVFPALTANRSRERPVRIWTLGCSSGEEAYSLAMALTEYLEDADLPLALQVIATDVNTAGIERARRGVYARSAVEHIGETRRTSFFRPVDGGYRISQAIRDTCEFTQHDVLTDAPLSGFDLVSCRNMLIYLGVGLQQKVISLLHEALRPNGFLWLGNAESIGAHRDLFQLRSARSKIYQRTSAPQDATGFPQSRKASVAPRGAAREIMIGEQESANEALRAANEEVHAAKAELQNIIDEIEESRKVIRSSEDAIKVINNEPDARNGTV